MLKYIVASFNKEKEKRPNLGSYILLCYSVVNKNYSRPVIASAFNKLVEKDEYDKSEKREYVEYLCKITKREKMKK